GADICRSKGSEAAARGQVHRFRPDGETGTGNEDKSEYASADGKRRLTAKTGAQIRKSCPRFDHGGISSAPPAKPAFAAPPLSHDSQWSHAISNTAPSLIDAKRFNQDERPGSSNFVRVIRAVHSRAPVGPWLPPCRAPAELPRLRRLRTPSNLSLRAKLMSSK